MIPAVSGRYQASTSTVSRCPRARWSARWSITGRHTYISATSSPNSARRSSGGNLNRVQWSPSKSVLSVKAPAATGIETEHVEQLDHHVVPAVGLGPVPVGAVQRMGLVRGRIQIEDLQSHRRAHGRRSRRVRAHGTVGLRATAGPGPPPAIAPGRARAVCSSASAVRSTPTAKQAEWATSPSADCDPEGRARSGPGAG